VRSDGWIIAIETSRGDVSYVEEAVRAKNDARGCREPGVRWTRSQGRARHRIVAFDCRVSEITNVKDARTKSEAMGMRHAAAGGKS
jgi:hypothetical protein